MILPIGKICLNQEGLGLLEVLVCVVLLSAGLIGVYRPLLNSMGVLYNTENRVIANRIANNQLWKYQEAMSRQRRLPDNHGPEVIAYKDKAFQFAIGSVEIDKKKILYHLQSNTSWKTGARSKSIKRAIYATTF